jgi:putative transposase
MRKSKFSENQIIAILKAVEAGRTVRDVCREHEVSEATYYQWKTKYGAWKPRTFAACVNSKRRTGA